MYSNTMMVVLNSRMTFSRSNDTVRSNEFSSVATANSRLGRPVFSTSLHGGISVTREQWGNPLEIYKIDVSIRYPNINIDIDI